MKKILITGANSYIGTSFERYVTEKYPGDYIVDTLDMQNNAWRTNDFSSYDSIFHVAAIVHQKETKKNIHLYTSVNRDLAIEVATKAKSEGVKQFVFLSSISVYGLDIGVINKHSVTNPKTNYAHSKLEAEEGIKALRSPNFKICILRPPMVYGDGCKGNYQLLIKLVNMLPVFPDYNNQRSMIYIDNLSNIVKLHIDRMSDGIFVPQDSKYVCTSDMVKDIAAKTGKKIKFTKFFNFMIPILIKVSYKARKAFGNLIYQD